MPAVSTNFHVSPPSSISSSTGSRVVPATESTTTRSAPASWLSRLDFPTLGRPSSATRRGPPSVVVRIGRVSRAARRALRRAGHRCRGRAARRRRRARRGPATTAAAASASVLASSTLLATSTTGLPARRSTRHDGLVGVGRADGRVDDEQHGVGGRRWRSRPGRRPARRGPSASCSQPPVSTTVKRRPFQIAS